MRVSLQYLYVPQCQMWGAGHHAEDKEPEDLEDLFRAPDAAPGSWNCCRASQTGLGWTIPNSAAPLGSAVPPSLPPFPADVLSAVSSSTDLHTTLHLILPCENHSRLHSPSFSMSLHPANTSSLKPQPLNFLPSCYRRAFPTLLQTQMPAVTWTPLSKQLLMPSGCCRSTSGEIPANTTATHPVRLAMLSGHLFLFAIYTISGSWNCSDESFCKLSDPSVPDSPCLPSYQSLQSWYLTLVSFP